MYEELVRSGCSVVICSEEQMDRFGNMIAFRGGAHITLSRRPPSKRKITWDSYDELAENSPARASWTDVQRLARHADAIVVGGYSTSLSRRILRIPRSSRAPAFIRAERPDDRTIGAKRVVRDALIRFAVGRAHAVFAMSERGRHDYEGFGAEVPILAPYSLPDLALVGPRSGIDGETVRVVVAGRMDARKDPLASIEVLRTLSERGEPYAASFVGTGPLIDQARIKGRELPIRFLGQTSQEAAQAEIAQADVLLHPCRYDGWGMVVSEAVASGTSVVASVHTDAAAELSRVCATVSAVPLETNLLADAVQSAAERRRSSSGLDEIKSAQRSAKELTGAREVAERVLAFLQKNLL